MLKKSAVGIKNFFAKYILTPDTKMWSFIKPTWLKAIIKALGFLIWAGFPYFCFIICEYIPFLNPAYTPGTGEDIEHLTRLFENRPSVIIFNLIILYTLSILLTVLFKRLWISCAVLGGLSYVLALASFFKYQARLEHLYPWDILQAGNLGTLSGFINTVFPVEFVHIALILFALVVILFFTRASIPVRWYLRIPSVLLASAIIAITCGTPASANAMLEKYTLSIYYTHHQYGNYYENGFIAAFFTNLLTSSVTKPDDYSKDSIYEIIGDYEYIEEGENFKYPNVILILQESFFDIERLPTLTFSRDPLENYKRITSMENSYSGNFATTASGGGTVYPEFDVLTGLVSSILPVGATPYQYIKNDLESYPSLLKSIGYKTISVHPYNSLFYLRETKYPLVGFDETWFDEELAELDIPIKYRGGNVSDDTFYDYLEYFIEETEEPMFMFGISMEGHQPYDYKFSHDDLEITVESDALDSATLDIVNMYTQCLFDADRAIGNFVDYLEECEEDTIVILFGDHAPTLGNDISAFRQTGLFDLTGMITAEQRPYLYTTPFMIYANFDLGESTMLSKDPKENLLAGPMLMNVALELIDAPKTTLMQFLTDYYDVLPYYTEQLLLELDEEMIKYVNYHRMLSYDRISGKKYSVTGK